MKCSFNCIPIEPMYEKLKQMFSLLFQTNNIFTVLTDYADEFTRGNRNTDSDDDHPYTRNFAVRKLSYASYVRFVMFPEVTFSKTDHFPHTVQKI